MAKSTVIRNLGNRNHEYEPQCINNKWVLVDERGVILRKTDGHYIREDEYDYIGPFADGYALVNIGGTSGYIDNSSPNFRKLPNRNDYEYSYFCGGLWGVINQYGETVIPCEYGCISIKEGIARVSHYGELIIEYRQHGIEYVLNFASNINYYLIKKNGRSADVPKGKIIAQHLSIRRGEDFYEGFAKVTLEPTGWNKEKIAYINRAGATIADSYDDGGDFCEGLACVGKIVTIEFKTSSYVTHSIQKMKYGFIDTNGKLVIPFQYDELGSFKNGKAIMKDGDERVEIIKEFTPIGYTFKIKSKPLHKKSLFKSIVDCLTEPF